MRSPFASILLLVAGCAAKTDSVPPVAGNAGKCEMEPLKAMIGQTPGDGTAAEALRLSGARTVRWKPPGAMVTMNYRPDRLNISLDARNRITAFDCG
jgi:hypothetical protein